MTCLLHAGHSPAVASSSRRCAGVQRPQAIFGSSPSSSSRPASSLRPTVATCPSRRLQDSIAWQQHGSSRRRSIQCQGLFGLGLPELAVIAGIAALVFGPSKLPELGKGLGKTVKSFQTAAKEFETELKQAAASDEPEKKPAEDAVSAAKDAAAAGKPANKAD